MRSDDAKIPFRQKSIPPLRPQPIDLRSPAEGLGFYLTPVSTMPGIRVTNRPLC